MATPAPRRRYIVGATKIRRRDRDVAHRALRAGASFGDIIGADTTDTDDRHPIGAPVTYTVELTDAEADEFRGASNLRYLEDDTEEYPAIALPGDRIPSSATLASMRAATVGPRWHGRDVPVAILDQGTTLAVRRYMGWTLVARQVFGDDPAPAEIWPGQDHGCLVAANGVPPGGRLLDALVTSAAGTSAASRATAAMRWAADLGCKIIVYSYSGSSPSSAYYDTFAYLAELGVHVYAAAGNDALPELGYPAAYSTTYTNVHSVAAFTETTDTIAPFSNRSADASGVAPGDDVLSLTPEAVLRTWDGTSAATPHAAQLCARGATGATFTAAQVATALDIHTRDTGSRAAEQGHGAYDLHAALTALGALPPPTDGVGPVALVDATQHAGRHAGYVLAAPSGLRPDDLRIVVLVASSGARFGDAPRAWRSVTEQSDGTTRVGVFATVHRGSDPHHTLFGLGADWHSSCTAIALRAPGAIDPDLLVPMVLFGAGPDLRAARVDPRRTSDRLLVVFAQRHPDAPTADLSTPIGLDRTGLVRPATGSTGYPTLLATSTLSIGSRTAAATSRSDDDTGRWVSVALTVPAGRRPRDLLSGPGSPGHPSALMSMFPQL